MRSRIEERNESQWAQDSKFNDCTKTKSYYHNSYLSLSFTGWDDDQCERAMTARSLTEPLTSPTIEICKRVTGNPKALAKHGKQLTT